MSWEDFVADVERDVAEQFDAGTGKYDISEGILKALHRRLLALEYPGGQPAEQPAEEQPAEHQAAELTQPAEQPAELTQQ